MYMYRVHRATLQNFDALFSLNIKLQAINLVVFGSVMLCLTTNGNPIRKHIFH